MAYDERLAERIERYFGTRTDVDQKKMFGGLCFMVNNHMCCGILQDELMARVGSEAYEECLNQEYARAMNFTGKVMKGMIYVSAQGIKSDDQLHRWIAVCENFIRTLPPKK